ncbi:helix-turn-helix domain-containing protein [Bradyrhizobium lablabi]|uniref:helix-turn-helix domain-containing protein n=1 Tax=Bradyrhizobium lablabi TaxID=722472 RepID=UPI001BADAF0D|nr:helix-turn-helix domain-containing protein [Bradyrhizobium lablabi]MBR0695137.1 helix-turn-helix domain-containing protein [Bradyrhizobium lablabi]
MPTTHAQPATFQERDDWMRAILKAELPHVAVRVALAIGAHLHVKSGRCDPSFAGIAVASHVSERTVYRLVSLLEHTGWIAMQRTGGRQRNQYTLLNPVTAPSGFNHDKARSGFDDANPDTALSASTLTECASNPDTKVAVKKRRTAKKEREGKNIYPAPGFAAPDSGDDTPTNRAEGGKAEIIKYSARDGGQEVRWDVRQYTVSALTHYQAGPSPCVWIGNLRKGFRKWSSICVNPNSYWFWTIEQDGCVIYDSRWDIPCAVTPPDPPPPDLKSTTAFAEFWAAYPLRKAKAAAERAFIAKIKRGADPNAMIAGAKRYANERAGQDPKFTKHPATWINGECWLDDPSPGTGPPTIDNSTGSVIADQEPQSAEDYLTQLRGPSRSWGDT